MTLQQDLVVGIVFVALISVTLALLLVDLLRHEAIDLREWWLDLCADAVTLWRTRARWALRRAAWRGLGMVLQAASLRCLERARALEAPVDAGALIAQLPPVVGPAPKAARRDVVVERLDDGAFEAQFGARVVRFRIESGR